MPRKKPTRHGATQPEEARKNQPLLLRLPPTVIESLRRRAEIRETTVSGLVMLLLEESGV